MAYKDFEATSARGMWAPPNGASTQVIPDQWKNNSGDELRYDLPDKTDDELVALGWKKVDMPSYETNGEAFYRNDYVWNSSTRVFDAVEYSDYEKQILCEYNNFWTKLLNSNFYGTLKTAASTTLAANVLYTEFITLITDAKVGRANITKIQASITAILGTVTFSTDEVTEFTTLCNSTGMSAVYTLS